MNPIRKRIESIRMEKDMQYYLIWSIEHNAWWGMGSNGYTVIRSQAGKYTHDEAAEIIRNANVGAGNVPNEAMIPFET